MDIVTTNIVPPYKAPDFMPEPSYGLQKEYISWFNSFINTVTFIWLLDYSKGFWVFPQQFTEKHVDCYGWYNDKWVGMVIPKEDIIAYF